MSCDRQRQRLIKMVATAFNGAVSAMLGGPDTAMALLGLVYDVASQQPVPEDKAGQLAAAAGFSAMQARADRVDVKIYPHKGKTPEPPMQQGWAAIHATLTALEQQRPLPPMADDALGSLTFGKFCRSGAGWCAEFAARAELRSIWAEAPERMAALVRGEMGDEEHAPFLRELTRRIAADPDIGRNRPLAAAARYYRTLDEAEMLEPEQRAQWARVLGGLAGVGVGVSWEVCARCGDFHEGECRPAYRDTLPQVAAAVAVALAHPDTTGFTPDDSPHVTLRQLLDDWEKNGGGRDAPTWVHGLLAAQHAFDRACIAEIASRGEYPSQRDQATLRAATIHAPLDIGGQPYVWDGGSLFPEAVYRRYVGRFDPTFVAHSLIPAEHRGREAVAQIRGDDLLPLMAGEPMLRVPIQWRPEELAQRYDTAPASPEDLRVGDTVVDGCGCVLSLAERAGSDCTYERLGGSLPACPAHPPDTFTVRDDHTVRQRIDPSRPRFRVTWPEPGPSGGAA